MKNTLKALAVIVTVTGLSMAACKSWPVRSYKVISITVTGIDGSALNGWEANMALGTDAFAMPLPVTESTASLTFAMVNMSDESFEIPGEYMVVLWFEKDGDGDRNYAIYSKRINGGSSAIAFSSFSPMQ
jgi:hypothetical protein